MKYVKGVFGLLKRAIAGIEYDSPVTLTFALICLIALFLGAVAGDFSAKLFSVYRAPLSEPLSWVRLFGHVFGHADYRHFIGNIALFMVLAPVVEEKYGVVRFIGMILITALVSGLFHMLVSPSISLMGASGVVFMLIFAAAFSGRRTKKVPLTIVLVALIYLGGELADGIFTRDGVSQLAHILGGLCGIGAGVVFRGRKGAHLS